MYIINEEAARTAKEMMSFDDYKQGSATSEYRGLCEEAERIAERQKKRTDPMYHEKIDYLLNLYERKLADNLNNMYSIESRCPSIMITGGSNFPVKKKQKQIAAMDKNFSEYQSIENILDKIKSVGMGGISSDDPDAIKKLQKKLDSMKKGQEMMKAVNAYYRKHKTLEGAPLLNEEQIKKLDAAMNSDWRVNPQPFPGYQLSNNNANIHRVENRIQELKNKENTDLSGWQFEGGEIVFDKDDNRLRVLFDEIPDVEIRNTLKHSGFKWSPKNKAWQRQITNNAIYTAKRIFPEV